MALFRRPGHQKACGAHTHLDADTLAAFAENSLARSEKAAVYERLAECHTCRDLLAAQAALNEFVWKNGTRKRAPTNITPYYLAAAGFLAAAALLFLLFPAKRSQMPASAIHAALALESPWGTQVAAARIPARRKPAERGVRVPGTANVTARPPSNLWPGWTAASLRRPGRNRLAAFTNVTIATFSFNNQAPAANQIALMTPLGQKWITVRESWQLDFLR